MGGWTSKSEVHAESQVSQSNAPVANLGSGTVTFGEDGRKQHTEQPAKPEEHTHSAALQRRFTVRNMPPRESVDVHVKHECEELLTKGTVEEGKGWEKIFENGEKLRVWRRKALSTNAFEYALRGKTDHEPHIFFKTAFLDIDNRMHWDESCGEARLLERCQNTGVETLYWITKYPWPVAERDYLFHRLVSKNEGSFHAVSWVGAPPTSLTVGEFTRPTDEVIQQLPKSRVRVTDYRTAMLVRPAPGGGALWCLRVLDDPKVAVVPTTVVNWIVTKTLPSSADKLDRACGEPSKSRA